MRRERSVAPSDGRASEVYRTAAQIILEKGYDATSVNDIARALGITKAGLYHYIHGKTQLLFDIMQYGLDELEREVAKPATEIKDAEARLRFMIETHARIVTRGQGAVTILVDEARALTPAQNRAIAKRKRAYLDFLRATLQQLRAEGTLRDVNITVAAFGILGTINWLSRWYQSDGALNEKQLAAQIVDIALNGLTKPSRRGLRAI
ncbi:MAG TPA: TetR/AcrR family transcriptional regulator [Thermoanaerobaculia bacterium]|nr:TetR/AcrR family transcriptional regulator [Thermoanaerobaculia bacterium]